MNKEDSQFYSLMMGFTDFKYSSKDVFGSDFKFFKEKANEVLESLVSEITPNPRIFKVILKKVSLLFNQSFQKKVLLLLIFNFSGSFVSSTYFWELACTRY